VDEAEIAALVIAGLPGDEAVLAALAAVNANIDAVPAEVITEQKKPGN
jgi:hypothetical protein